MRAVQTEPETLCEEGVPAPSSRVCGSVPGVAIAGPVGLWDALPVMSLQGEEHSPSRKRQPCTVSFISLHLFRCNKHVQHLLRAQQFSNNCSCVVSVCQPPNTHYALSSAHTAYLFTHNPHNVSVCIHLSE